MPGFDKHSLIGWALLIVAALLTAAHSYWWITLVIPMALWKAATLYVFYGRPWSRIHYPAMRAYSRATAYELIACQRGGRDFDVCKAVSIMVKQLHPKWSHDRIRELVNREFDRYESLADRELIEARLRRRFAGTRPEEFDALIEELPLFYETQRNAMIIRLVIAGIIEHRYGTQDRAEYLTEVVLGNAK